jgi:thymidylate synthase
MKPLMVTGNGIAETWEKALLALYEGGEQVQTQYDVDPNTGHQYPPSLDCSMVMHVENAVAEPRLHVCLQGGVDDLEEYRMEVVEGVKNHWVKRSPDEKYWTYTYPGRLREYGDRMNFACSRWGNTEGLDPWVKLGYRWDSRWDYDGSPTGDSIESQVEEIEPFDQIQYIIDSIAETPYTRRAIAVTSFPPADAPTDDPPCLREVWVRGYYRDGVLKLDMQTYWRSRDAWGAALYNMYGLTELQRYIAVEVQKKLDQMHPYKEEWMTDKGECPVCGSTFYPYSGPRIERNAELVEIGNYRPGCESLICGRCGIHPYAVSIGSYTDYASSFHIYGKDIPTFEAQMLSAVKNRTPEGRMYDVSKLLAGGEEERVRQRVMEKIARVDKERFGG